MTSLAKYSPEQTQRILDILSTIEQELATKSSTEAASSISKVEISVDAEAAAKQIVEEVEIAKQVVTEVDLDDYKDFLSTSLLEDMNEESVASEGVSSQDEKKESEPIMSMFDDMNG